MKCPACTNADLLMGERQGVEIDYCPTCRGVWLDRGELDKIIERSLQQEVQHPTRQPHAQSPDIHGIGHARFQHIPYIPCWERSSGARSLLGSDMRSAGIRI